MFRCPEMVRSERIYVPVCRSLSWSGRGRHLWLSSFQFPVFFINFVVSASQAIGVQHKFNSRPKNWVTNTVTTLCTAALTVWPTVFYTTFVRNIALVAETGKSCLTFFINFASFFTQNWVFVSSFPKINVCPNPFFRAFGEGVHPMVLSLSQNLDPPCIFK